MSLFEERRKRKAQARANAYIKSLKGKEIKDIEKSFLDNKEFENRIDMIKDLTISYVCGGIKTILTINDDHVENTPYNLADIFERVIRDTNANPQIVIENLKNAFEYE